MNSTTNQLMSHYPVVLPESYSNVRGLLLPMILGFRSQRPCKRSQLKSVDTLLVQRSNANQRTDVTQDLTLKLRLNKWDARSHELSGINTPLNCSEGLVTKYTLIRRSWYAVPLKLVKIKKEVPKSPIDHQITKIIAKQDWV